MPEDDRMMRVGEIAKFFSVTTYTVREWFKAFEKDNTKGLKGFKVNGQWRAYQSDVHAYAQREYGATT